MSKKFRILLLAILVAGVALVLVWSVNDGQLSPGVAGILASLIVVFSLLTMSNGSFRKRAFEPGIHSETTETQDDSVFKDFHHPGSPELLAMLSHELRTPMNVMLGVTDLMRLTDLSHQQRSYLRAIQGSGDSLMILLDNFLDFSDLDSGGINLEDQEFDVVELVERVLRTMGYQAYAQGIELIIDAPAEISLMASGDPHRLRQVLVNLLGNWIRLSEASEILVRVAVKPEKANALRLLVSVVNQSDDGFVELEESLSWSGEMLDIDTDDMRQGNKLGLAVCKRLVESMGGKIGIARGVDDGITGWISVPLEKRALLPGTQVTSLLELQGKTAIVIKGNPLYDRIICRYLETWGMQCVMAADISSASTLLQEEGGTKINVAVIDANIAEIKTPEVNSEVSESAALAGLPLVLLTTIGETLGVNSISSSDNFHFVTKPVLPGELRYSLLKVFGSDALGTQKEVVSGHVRILIADDNTANGHMLIAMLRSLGCDPDYVEDGPAALKMLAQKPYDLVLMDCEMPGLNGDKVTLELRTNHSSYASQPVVIAVTATSSEELRSRCLSSGMNGFIVKPIRLEALKAGLQQWPLLSDVKSDSDDKESGQSAVVVDELETKVLAQLYSRLGGSSTEVLCRYIDMFLSDSLSRLESLHAALLTTDTEVLSDQSHALKGACLEVGHERMSQYCDDLRAACEQGNFDDASLIVDSLDEEFGNLSKILEAKKSEVSQLP